MLYNAMIVRSVSAGDNKTYSVRNIGYDSGIQQYIYSDRTIDNNTMKTMPRDKRNTFLNAHLRNGKQVVLDHEVSQSGDIVISIYKLVTESMKKTYGAPLMGRQFEIIQVMQGLFTYFGIPNAIDTIGNGVQLKVYVERRKGNGGSKVVCTAINSRSLDMVL